MRTQISVLIILIAVLQRTQSLSINHATVKHFRQHKTDQGQISLINTSCNYHISADFVQIGIQGIKNSMVNESSGEFKISLITSDKLYKGGTLFGFNFDVVAQMLYDPIEGESNTEAFQQKVAKLHDASRKYLTLLLEEKDQPTDDHPDEENWNIIDWIHCDQ